jgi:glyoxylase-like metal-dependent hydrolase (beta-lactamase superfamily II)/8-oxo-dGTP pyrophosphatase MutT (NUDIX family)
VSDEPSLYERVMARAGEAGAVKPKPPRPSAAVVLWRRDDDGEVEVFWIQRAEAMPFMGGWHAFPGGGVSSADLAVPVQGMPAGMDEGLTSADAFPESLSDGLPEEHALEPDLVPGLLVCAIRELFEETGVLLVEELLPDHHEGPVTSTGQLDEARERLIARQARFGEVIAELGLTPDVSRLTFAGRWLTPPFAPLRFDNRFFLLEWPRRAALQPSLRGEECADGEWVEPAAAWRRWRDGEVLAAPPILHLLKVLAEEGPEAGLPRLRHPAEADLGPFRRIEFRPGVLLLPLATHTLPPADRTNAYLLGTGAERVLVDPGSHLRREIGRLTAAVDALAAGGEGRVTAIWLTHHHPDHVGGVEALRRHLGVPVLAHPKTAELLAGRGIAVDGTLADGQRVVLAGGGEPDFPLRVLHTPGHAPGHLCFYDETWGSLVAGDLVAGLGTIVIDPPQGDMDAYLASLERLIELAPATLFPAHGPAIRDAVGKLREYVEHRLWREEKVLAAWRDGLREPQAMLPRVYDDVPEQAWPLAERQIVAHLERLERAGRLG